LRVLILGGYGFIGREIASRLIAAGHEITGVGRSIDVGKRLLPEATWIATDIAKLQTPVAWHNHLEGIDAVVNAAGALQSGRRDNVEAIHHLAIAALVSACEAQGVDRLVQISAAGANASANTQFMRSKARGDSCVKTSSLRWIIVRPGLVVGANAYGGTALIRVLSSIPIVQPIAFGNQQIQTVSAHDLAEVTVDALDGQLPAQTEFDLVEDEQHTLLSIVQQFRVWLGVRSARTQIAIPDWVLYAFVTVADIFGHLGWRSPLRTTTMRVLSGGVIGDPSVFRQISDRKLLSLTQSLSRMPSTLQERWFARLYFTMPAAIGVLAIFWLLTGLIALLNLETATVMTGLSADVGKWAVIFGAGIDIGLGASILYRPWARSACWGMVVVTVFYLLVGSIVRPDLWADPLGPLVKTLPVLMLAVVAGLMLEER
jgi:uncharacterized protein YbjT (DUF2867 family)